MSTIERRAMEWLVGTDTGISSVAICRHMLGIARPRKHSHPRDGGDLGRCLRLLELIPEWKSRINEMAEHGPYWAALAARWDELEVSLSEEAGSQFERFAKSPKTYNLMRQILDPITDKDSSVVRLGEGVTMSFGE